MQINSNIQSNVLTTQNRQTQKVEQNQVEELKVREEQTENTQEKITERRFQEVINSQDDMIMKVNENNKKDLSADLAKIEESLKVANDNQKFISEDFSKINKDLLKQNQESFRNSQQANINQAQLATLLA